MIGSLYFCFRGVLLLLTNNFYQQFLHYSPWIFAGVVATIAGYLYLRNRRSEPSVPEPETSQSQADDSKLVIEFSRYLGGHPDIHEQVNPSLVYFDEESLHICRYKPEDHSKVLSMASIPLYDVVKIKVEDYFTMKSKINPSLWKQEIKIMEAYSKIPETNLAFLVIEWTHGISSQFTYFTIEGELAMEYAVKKRNALVRLRKQHLLVTA